MKELEGVIQRRFPNSLSALILASAAAESGAEDGAAKGRVRTEAAAPSTHLERRVHQLEKQLETKDQESARRMRALQQKYTAMEVQCTKLTVELCNVQLSITNHTLHSITLLFCIVLKAWGCPVGS